MHGALYDDLLAAGGIRLIPAELCRQRHVGRWFAWAVLAHMAVNANTECHSFRSAGTLAAELGGCDRRSVRNAHDLLAELKLIVRVGVENRSVKWRVQIPDAARDVARYPATSSGARSGARSGAASGAASGAESGAISRHELNGTEPNQPSRASARDDRGWIDALLYGINAHRRGDPLNSTGQIRAACAVIADAGWSVGRAYQVIANERGIDLAAVRSGLIARKLADLAAELAPTARERARADATPSRLIDEKSDDGPADDELPDSLWNESA